MSATVKQQTITSETERIIEIRVTQVDTTKDGKKTTFLAYKGVQKDGKLIDVRFVKEIKVLPTEKCRIRVKVVNMNIDKSHTYPRLWIKQIEEILPIEVNTKALEETADMF